MTAKEVRDYQSGTFVKKFGVKKNLLRPEFDKEMKKFVGAPGTLDDKEEVQIAYVIEPVVVEGVGETIVLSEDEREALKLGPKFCVLNDLCEETFEADIEECLLKVKWDMMSHSRTGPRGYCTGSLVGQRVV